MSEIIIDKNAKQITFTNNGIAFSQFGIANEILDLIENQEKEIERLNKRIEDLNIINEEHKTLNGMIRKELQQKENIIKEVREDLHQVVKWCTENKHNEDTIERYLVVDYGTIVGKINEIRTKLDKEVN